MTNENDKQYPAPDTEATDDGVKPTLPPVMPAPTFEGLAVGGPVDTQGVAGEQGAETNMDDVAP